LDLTSFLDLRQRCVCKIRTSYTVKPVYKDTKGNMIVRPL